MVGKYIERLYGWYGKRTVRLVSLVLFVLLGVVIFKGGGEVAPETLSQVPKEVSVATPASLSQSNELVLVGTVDAKTQAKLLAESAGRVIAVNVTLGQIVAPGAVIAQLENATERASLLQAEGAYEAAIAAAAESTLTVSGAENSLQATKNSLLSTHANAYNTIAGLVATSVDDYFSNPDGTIPGLRIDGQGNTANLNTARVSLQADLFSWRESASNLTAQADLSTALISAVATTDSVLNITNDLLVALNDPNRSDRYSDDEYSAFIVELTRTRAEIIGIRSSLTSAETNLVAANEALARAKLAGTGVSNEPSLSDARVKQALGVLRAAEANLAKTIIRSPIGGTVNSLSVRAGDYVGMNAAIAEVANNAGFEVITYVSPAEAVNLKVGTVVRLSETATGTVTSVSPAITSATGKIEVRIGSTAADLKTGSTVNVKIPSATRLDDPRVFVPLAAVKLTTDAATIFTVSDGNILVAVPITLGMVSGDHVEVVSGLSNDTPIVLDARGRKAGETVTIAK